MRNYSVFPYGNLIQSLYKNNSLNSYKYILTYHNIDNGHNLIEKYHVHADFSVWKLKWNSNTINDKLYKWYIFLIYRI